MSFDTAEVEDWLQPDASSNGNVSYQPSDATGLIILLTTCLETLRDVEKSSVSRPTHMNKDRAVADYLANKVSVLCWVMTHPANHESKARHVKATWGKRCNKLLFMSTQEDNGLPTVKLPVSEGRNALWAKTKAAFKYVYENHRNDADWFLKADDDTYVVVENLRYMLSKYNTSDPIYFGCRYKPYAPEGYMSGGAGYVLSREALDRFVNKGLNSPAPCVRKDTGAEDVNMGICLYNVGVKAMDSRDDAGRGRFFPFIPRDHLFPEQTELWYRSYIYYPSNGGIDSCSDHAISYHYVNPHSMYLYDYLIYHVRPYGIRYGVDAEMKENMENTMETTTLKTTTIKNNNYENHNQKNDNYETTTMKMTTFYENYNPGTTQTQKDF